MKNLSQDAKFASQISDNRLAQASTAIELDRIVSKDEEARRAWQDWFRQNELALKIINDLTVQIREEYEWLSICFEKAEELVTQIAALQIARDANKVEESVFIAKMEDLKNLQQLYIHAAQEGYDHIKKYTADREHISINNSLPDIHRLTEAEYEVLLNNAILEIQYRDLVEKRKALEASLTQTGMSADKEAASQ